MTRYYITNNRDDHEEEYDCECATAIKHAESLVRAQGGIAWVESEDGKLIYSTRSGQP